MQLAPKIVWLNSPGLILDGTTQGHCCHCGSRAAEAAPAAPELATQPVEGSMLVDNVRFLVPSRCLRASVHDLNRSNFEQRSSRSRCHRKRRHGEGQEERWAEEHRQHRLLSAAAKDGRCRRQVCLSARQVLVTPLKTQRVTWFRLAAARVSSERVAPTDCDLFMNGGPNSGSEPSNLIRLD